MSSRLLPVPSIPTSLWISAPSKLIMPSTLTHCFNAEIDRLKLRELALTPVTDDGPTGGITLEQTHCHFAQRFSSSSGRVQLALLDPKDELTSASDYIINVFSGGEVALLDIPCGSGAATASLLSTVAQLRLEGCLPCQPLKVSLLGGDISQHALDLANGLMDSLRPNLEQCGIELHTHWKKWDVLDALSTTELINRWVTIGVDARIHCVVAANFSAFLERDGKLKEAKAQLNQIFLWANVRRSQVVWIEPQTNVSKSFFEGMFTKLKAGLQYFGLWRESVGEPHAKTECVFQNPLDNTKSFPVRLSIILLKRAGSD